MPMSNEPSLLRFSTRLLLSSMLAVTTTPGWAAPRDVMPEEAAQIEGYEGETRASGRATVGGRVGENLSEGYLDVLQPLVAGENGLLFFNPKLSGSDNDEEEYSLGLGVRVLCPAVEAIAGANIFYDSRNSRNGNTFDQVGAGVEVLTTWVDARANYYWPDDKQELIDSQSDTEVERDTDYYLSDIYAEGHQLLQLERIKTTTITTTRYFERFEAAMEGYDAELGAKLPFLPPWMETRVFAGYYNFEGDFTKDVDGFKGRLEIRALPALTLDAEFYDDDALTGSDYFFGARVNLPFDVVNLARGKNPFAGTEAALKARQQAFSERLSEMVIRDPHVRLHESGFIENKDLKDVDVDVDVEEDEKVVLDDINFVNNGNNSGFENGTDEHPYNTVQEGVDNVFGEKNVYVYQGVGGYSENLTIKTSGVRLLGEGCAIEGSGGEKFGGGKYPLLNGNVAGVNGPVIRVSASDVLIQGFEVSRAAGGSNPGQTDALGLGQTIDRVGILAENADNLTIRCNLINNQETGVLALYDATEPGAPADLSLQVLDNTFDESDLGLSLIGVGPGGRFSALVQDNVFESLTAEFQASLSLLDYVSLSVRENTFREAGSIAAASVSGVQDASLAFDENRFESGGVVSFVTGSVLGDLDLSLSGNEFTGPSTLLLVGGVVGGNSRVSVDGNFMDGGNMTIVQGVTTGDSRLSVSDNTLLNAPGGAITLVGGSVDGITTLALDNNVIRNPSGAGITAVLGAMNDDLFASVSGNTIEGALGSGATVVGGAVDGDALLVFSDNQISGSAGVGFAGILPSTTGDLEVYASGNRITDNQSVGLFLSGSTVGGDAAISILDSVFDNNLGGGLNLSVPSVAGTLSVLVDPTTANGNGAPGMVLSLNSTESLRLLMQDVTANDNVGGGIIVFANSASGTVQAAFVDVEASRNTGPGLSATVVAQDDVYLFDGVIPLSSNVIANDIVADGNTVGIVLSGTSVSGGIYQASQRLQANDNTGSGIIMNFSAVEEVGNILGSVEASRNGGPGFVLSSISESGVVITAISQIKANQNLGPGALVQIQAEDAAQTVIGFDVPFLGFSLNTGSPGIEASGNQGIGLQISSVAAHGGSVLGLGRAVANSNTAAGIVMNVTAEDDIMGLLGLNISDLGSAPLEASFNGGDGLVFIAQSLGGGVQAFSPQGRANGNAGNGANFQVQAAESIQLGLGTFLTPGSNGYFQANNNQGGSGLILNANSASNDVTLILADVEANSNAVFGMASTLVASGDVTTVMGGFILDSVVRANGNVAGGIYQDSIAGGDLRFIAGELQANDSVMGSGVTLNQLAQGDVETVLGLGVDLATTNLLVAPVTANRNGTDGVRVNATSAGGDVVVTVGDLEVNGNFGSGASIAVTGSNSVLVALGELVFDAFTSNVVEGQVVASSNGVNGLDVTATSGGGTVTALLANISAYDNAAIGMHVNLTAGRDVNASLRDGVFNDNGTLGLDLNYTAGSNAYVTVENVQANNNAANFVRSFNPSGGNIELIVRNVTATNNGGVGLVVNAIADNSTTVVVENVTANENQIGVDLYTRATTGSAFVQVSNVVVNGNSNDGMEVDVLAKNGASVGLYNSLASGNTHYGFTVDSDGGTNSSTVYASSVAAHNNQTGMLLVARAAVNAAVIMPAGFGGLADSNSVHGIVAAVEAGNSGAVNVNTETRDNGRYGTVALVVSTGAVINSVNTLGLGNGDGNTFQANNNVAPFEALLP